MKDNYNTRECTSDLAVWQGYDQSYLHLVNEESIHGSCLYRPPRYTLLHASHETQKPSTNDPCG
jgi:hypothetical protein